MIKMLSNFLSVNKVVKFLLLFIWCSPCEKRNWFINFDKLLVNRLKCLTIYKVTWEKYSCNSMSSALGKIRQNFYGRTLNIPNILCLRMVIVLFFRFNFIYKCMTWLKIMVRVIPHSLWTTFDSKRELSSF